MRKMDPHALYRSAITNADGSVNTGYVVLFKMIRMLWIILTIVTVMAMAAAFAAYPNPHDVAEVMRIYAIACGIVAGSMFGAGLSACGVFLWGDSHNPSAPLQPAPPLNPNPLQPIVPPPIPGAEHAPPEP